MSLNDVVQIFYNYFKLQNWWTCVYRSCFWVNERRFRATNDSVTDSGGDERGRSGTANEPRRRKFVPDKFAIKKIIDLRTSARFESRRRISCVSPTVTSIKSLLGFSVLVSEKKTPASPEALEALFPEPVFGTCFWCQSSGRRTLIDLDLKKNQVYDCSFRLRRLCLN